MVDVNQEFTDFEKLLDYIDVGVIAINQKNSGTFLMFENCINAFCKEYNGHRLHNTIKFISIDEEHPLFYRLMSRYQVQNAYAIMLLVREGDICDVINSPVSKSELLNLLNTTFNLTAKSI